MPFGAGWLLGPAHEHWADASGTGSTSLASHDRRWWGGKQEAVIPRASHLKALIALARQRAGSWAFGH